jgi:hypothetical protein
MARDRKRHASDKEVPTAPPVAMPVTLSAHPTMAQHREDFLAMIRALAREAARRDHEAGLAKTPDPRHSKK